MMKAFNKFLLDTEGDRYIDPLTYLRAYDKQEWEAFKYAFHCTHLRTYSDRTDYFSKYEIFSWELNKYPDDTGKDTYSQVRLWGGSNIVSALWHFMLIRRKYQHVKLYSH
jgi:hypothetical protein